MTPEHPTATVNADAATALPAIEQVSAAKLEMLESNEVIEFTIKPSLWYIAIVSARTIGVLFAAGCGLALLDRLNVWSVPPVTYTVIVAAMLARIGVGMLQWASSVYVLTNRRAMRFSGVLRVQVRECRLKDVRRAYPYYALYHRLLRLGSVRIRPQDERAPMLRWEHVSRPQQIYEKLARAIRNANR